MAGTILVAALLVTVGCTRLGTPVTARTTEAGKKVVQMRAQSYEFQPNNIKIFDPGPLTMIIDNVSGTEHNITIKNREGQVLKSVDLPPQKTTSVSVNLPARGTYDFYCNKDLHATLGMKGQIQVGS